MDDRASKVIDEHSTRHLGFVHPNWQSIAKWADDNVGDGELGKFYHEIALEWAQKTGEADGNTGAILETENFVLLSNANDDIIRNQGKFLERVLSTIKDALEDIVFDEGFGPHVVFSLSDDDSYYRYIDFASPEGKDLSASSGCFIDKGYGHLVFSGFNPDHDEPVIAHEMTHALLRHLDIPLWINEGLAVTMERQIIGLRAWTRDTKRVHKQCRYWRETSIQNFWAGWSFQFSGLANHLSYDLAQFLVTRLSKRYKKLCIFVNQASIDDSGASAYESVYGKKIELLVSELLGKGNWEPRPNLWAKSREEAHQGISIKDEYQEKPKPSQLVTSMPSLQSLVWIVVALFILAVFVTIYLDKCA